MKLNFIARVMTLGQTNANNRLITKVLDNLCDRGYITGYNNMADSSSINNYNCYREITYYMLGHTYTVKGYQVNKLLNEIIADVVASNIKLFERDLEQLSYPKRFGGFWGYEPAITFSYKKLGKEL